MRRPTLLLALLALAPLRAEESWPRFRGPTGQGLSTATGLPLAWSETEHVKWKTPLPGKAWSSPVVLGDQVWVTDATADGRDLSAVCLDRATGKIVRAVKLFHVAAPQYADAFNSYGSPTPVVEPGRVYVTFGSPGTACLDTQTGQVLWQRTDFVCNHWRGSGSSPALWRDLLILHFDGVDFQYVVALDKATGRTVWKTDRSVDFQDLDPSGKPIREGDFRKAFSTPLVIAPEGKPVLISTGSRATYGYDPATGAELWRVEDHRHHSGSVTPVAGDGLVYAATGLARGDLIAVKLAGAAGVLPAAAIAWRATRGAPNRPSPVLAGGLLFMVHQDSGVATCLDAATGAQIWSERLPITGHHSASPLLAEGRVYFFSETGQTAVVAAAREFQVLGTSKLEAGFMASPAVAGRALYLRTKAAVYRIEM